MRNPFASVLVTTTYHACSNCTSTQQQQQQRLRHRHQLAPRRSSHTKHATMLSAVGAVGLFLIQYQAHKEEVHAQVRRVLRSVAAARGDPDAARAAAVQQQQRLSGGSLDSSSSSRSPFKHHPQQQQHHGSRAAVRDGAFVCFRDRTGQVAVVQPHGNGGSYQLTFTCASGSSRPLPEGAGSLSHINSDAVFLVRQVGNNFAFSSPGAEGRYLSAVRDLAVPPVLDSTRCSPAAQWRVTGQGITNVLHPHKKLACSIAKVKLVPLESIAAVEHSIAEHNREQQGKIAAAEAVSKALQSQLAEAAKHLTATTAEYDTQVQALQDQLGEACSFNSQLTGLVELKDSQLAKLQGAFSQIKTQHQEAERELSTAYSEVAALQQQLAERDDDVTHLQQRMCSETKQWNQLRGALQDSLAAKDEDINTLTLQVQRMEHALRSVEHTLYGMRKPRRLDRASLDLVSINQLQAAVDNFAAVGEGAGGAAAAVDMVMAAHEDMSTAEAEALRVLLEQQTGAEAAAARHEYPGGVMMMGRMNMNPDADPFTAVNELMEGPGTELSLQDLDSQPHDQQHNGPAAAAGGGGAKAGGGGVGGSRRGLSAAWGLSDDSTTTAAAGASSSSRVTRAVRSSAASEGRHRYADSDDDDQSQDGEQQEQEGAAAATAGAAADAQHLLDADAAAVQQAARGRGRQVVADDDDDDAAVLCGTSMDEAELQQQLRALKASASQLTAGNSSSMGSMGGSGISSSRCSSRVSSGRTRQQQAQQTAQSGPLHSGIAASRSLSSSSGGAVRPFYSASLTQLSPVKEERRR